VSSVSIVLHLIQVAVCWGCCNGFINSIFTKIRQEEAQNFGFTKSEIKWGLKVMKIKGWLWLHATGIERI
jgi:hypothetical protein